MLHEVTRIHVSTTKAMCEERCIVQQAIIALTASYDEISVAVEDLTISTLLQLAVVR
jgi:hypothetical protein